MSEGTELEGQRRLTEEQIEEIRQGRVLLHNFFSVLRTAAYHASNNLALEEPSKNFAVSLREFSERLGGKVKIEVGEGQIFAGTIRLRPSKRQRSAIDAMEKFLRRRGLGGLIFNEPVEAEVIRDMISVVVAFKKPLLAENGVEALGEDLKAAGFGHLLAGTIPVQVRLKGDAQKAMKDLGQVGQLAVQLSRGVAMVKATIDDDSEIARAGTRHVVREITDLEPEVRDAVVGLAMLGSSDDMAMRSLMILLVAVATAEELHATRAVKADLGQACIELARYDRPIRDGVEDEDAARRRVGVQALDWLAQQNAWTMSTLRQGLSLASRYMPPGKKGPSASPMGELLRAASDYTDLTTPSPLNDSELFLSGAPLPPHQAIQRMRQQVGKRYSSTVLRALVRGVGILPVGTPVEMADGHGAIVVERTGDPTTFVVQDTLSRRRREASFAPGPNQIVRVVTGGDLLKVRSHFLLGDDHEKLEKISEGLLAEEDG